MTHRSRWTRIAPARLGKALVLVVAIQVLVTAWTGVLASSDPADPEVPATFFEPEVRAGDHAVYAVQGPEGGDRPTIGGRTLRAVAVEWAEPGWSMTGNGSFRWAMPMSIYLDLQDTHRPGGPLGTDAASSSKSRSDDGTAGRYGPSFDLAVSVSYDTATWMSLGSARTTWEEHTTRYAELQNRSVRDRADKRVWRYHLADPATPCGFHLPFHGRPTDLAAPLGAAGDCGPDRTLEAVAVHETGGTRALRLASGTGDPVRVSYAPEIPLPVRWSGLLDALGLHQDGRVVLELSEWGPGDGPTPDDPTGPRPAPFVVQTAPREPWGPAEGRLQNVSFTLSKAYEVLTDQSPDVQSFLADNPDAYTARAWMYRDRDRAQRPRTTWQIVLTDGTDHIERFVVRSDPVEVPGTDRKVAPPAEVVTRDRAPVEAPHPADRYPPPDRRPGRLPVVGDGSIHAHDTAGYAPWETGDAGHYGLATSCHGEGCSDPATVVEVGTTMAPLLGTPGPKTPWAQNRSAVRFGLTPDGEVAYIEGTGKVGTGPTVAETQGQGSSPPAPARTLEEAPWTFPSQRTAVGLSLMAVLTGVLYYVWPKVKILGAGLYSRISRDRDEVLEHDARREIHRLVQVEPGIHFRELKRRLDTGVGILEHHLEKLVAADLLVERRSEGYRCYFPFGSVDRKVMQAADRLRSDRAREILQAIRDRPGASITDLADATGLSRSTAGYHLDRLAEVGLIDKSRDGRSVAVEVTDLGLQAMDELDLASTS